MSENLLIQTTLVSTFASPEQWVYVTIGDMVVRKKVQDLNCGDVVVVHTESIDTTLADILPVLQQSIRYQHAQSYIFQAVQRGEKEEKMPVLAALIRTGSGFLLEHILEDEERKAIAERLAPCVTVRKGTVMEWIDGKTMAPYDWENFSHLSQINPQFLGIYRSKETDDGFYANYQFLTGIHRAIMAYLAQKNGSKNITTINSESRSWSEESRENGRFTEEMRMVLRHFIHEIDCSKTGARIIRITKMDEKEGRKNSHPSSRAAPEPKLKRGLYTGEIENTPFADMNEVQQGEYILDVGVSDVLNAYMLIRMRERPVTHPLFWRLIPYYFKKKGSHSPQSILQTELESLADGCKGDSATIIRWGRTFLEEEYKRFVSQMISGGIDLMLAIPNGTVASLSDQYSRYQSALPAAYHQRTALQEEYNLKSALIGSCIDRKKRRELEREVRRAEGQTRHLNIYLAADYGMTAPLRHFFFEDGPLGTIRPFNYNLIQVSPTEKQMIGNRKRLEEQGMTFITSSELAGFLEKIHLGAIRKFYNNNCFVGERSMIESYR